MLQSSLDEIVVVAISGIDRYGTSASLRRDRERIVFWCIGKPNHDHTPRLRPQRLWMASRFSPGREPSHIAVITGRNEVGQPRPRFRTKLSVTEANRIETDAQSGIPDLAPWVERMTCVRNAADRRPGCHLGHVPLLLTTP